jgi:diguanylate cyclase (GGDEF)-like protein/PAS domain S-box-containing protein
MTNAPVLLASLQQEIDEKSEFNLALYNASPIGVAIFDEHYKFIDCNEAMLAIFGVTKEYYKSHFSKLSPKHQNDGTASRKKLYEHMKSALEGKEVVTEWMHCSPFGEPIPCEVTMKRINDHGRCIGVGYVYDLRAVKRAESILGEVEGLARAIAETSPLAHMLFNEDLQPLDCNDAMLQVLSCPNKQYLLENYWKIFSPVYQPDGQKSSEKRNVIIKDSLDYGKVVYEWAYKTIDGELIFMENTLTPVMCKEKKYFIVHKHNLNNIRKMEESIRMLESQAEKIFYDPLTGIYNRRYFDETLKNVLNSLSRSNGLLSLMMVDIDFFKNFNDTYGHSEGDNCLKMVAETLSKTITRSGDFVARYGGEEFAIVLPNTDEKGACNIAEKMLKNIRHCKIPHMQSSAAEHVTISIGVTTGTVSHTQSEDDYIKQADKLLYQSKHEGRNRFTFERFN